MRVFPLRGIAVAALAAGAWTGPAMPLGAQEPPAPRVVVPVPPAHGWLGISLTVTNAGETGDERILVTDVWGESPAEAAGLRTGDRILRVNGVAVSAEQFRSMTQRLAPGDPMALRVVRDGREMDLTVVAGARPGREVLVPQRLQAELDLVRGRLERILEGTHVQVVRDGPDGGTDRVGLMAPTIVVERMDGDSITTRVFLGGDSVASTIDVRGIREEGGFRLEASAPGQERNRSFSIRVRTDSVDAAAMEAVVRPLAPFLAGMTRVAGAEMREMSPGLAGYFGVESGLLVTSVVDGTPAAVAGLRGGDVIVAAGGTAVTSIQQLRSALGGGGSGTVLEVVRKGERMEMRIR